MSVVCTYQDTFYHIFGRLLEWNWLGNWAVGHLLKVRLCWFRFYSRWSQETIDLVCEWITDNVNNIVIHQYTRNSAQNLTYFILYSLIHAVSVLFSLCGVQMWFWRLQTFSQLKVVLALLLSTMVLVLTPSPVQVKWFTWIHQADPLQSPANQNLPWIWNAFGNWS